MIQEIKKGFYTKITTSNSFNTSIGGRFTFNEPVDDNDTSFTEYPYAVGRLRFNPLTRNSENRFETGYLQLDIYQNPNGDSPEKIGVITDKAIVLLDDCETSLIIQGYSAIRIDREDIPYRDNNATDTTRIQRAVLIYKFYIEED